jgi:hypothetical protein
MPVSGYVSIPARGHVGGVVAVKTSVRAEATILVQTILDASSGVRMQKRQFTLTRSSDIGLEASHTYCGACVTGGGGWESPSDDGTATMKRGREMATNVASRPRRALSEVRAHVSQDVPEHD